jgi:formylglycine-generating enzyme required for sulfatase activity
MFSCGSPAGGGRNPGHTHEWGSEWQHNTNQHWKECECGEDRERASHVDETSNERCDTCDYDMSEGVTPPPPPGSIVSDAFDDDDVEEITLIKAEEAVNFPVGSGNTPIKLSPFYISKYEVTQEQYEAVTGDNPSYFQGSSRLPADGEEQGKRPVETVTWYDAIEFCNKLSVMEGLEQVYKIEGRTPASGYPITNAMVIADHGKNGYRLPTETEWEYAARGGHLDGDTYDYTSGNAEAVAWYRPGAGSKTHEVGKKAPNDLGLYDMIGNVYEWCGDWYGGTYPYDPDTPTEDPKGAASGTYRVLRGGSWDRGADYLRSADRGSSFPYYGDGDIGFRLVRP